MSRRSTAVGRGGVFMLTCDGCWDGFNSYGPDWRTVEGEAAREGWRFVGHGMSAREYCGRCQ